MSDVPIFDSSVPDIALDADAVAAIDLSQDMPQASIDALDALKLLFKPKIHLKLDNLEKEIQVLLAMYAAGTVNDDDDSVFKAYVLRQFLIKQLSDL